MKIVAVTRVLNEEDIIEAMVRHHAVLVDHHILLDNGSEDRTLEILASLKCEGVSLSVLQNDTVIFAQSHLNTFLYRSAVEQHLADWVLYLDADEFLDTRKIGDLRAYLAKVPAAQRCLGVELINYDAPSVSTEQELNVVRRFTRRVPKPIGVWKVMVRGGADADRVAVDAGNHQITVDGNYVEPLIQHELLLAHFPNRSPLQWAAKAVTGRLRVLGAGQPELRRGRSSHYVQTMENLKRDPQTWLRETTAGFEWMKTSGHLVDDPIAYLGSPLLYTQSVNYGWRAVALVLSTVEKITSKFGTVLDTCPSARAVMNAGMDDTQELFEFPPVMSAASGGPAPVYGAIVTQVWRRVTDPSFGTLLGDGWSIPEGWGGIWGVGAKHELRLTYPSLPKGDTEIEADVLAALNGPQEMQSVAVYVLGEKLAIWEFTRVQNREIRKVRIPRALIARGLPTILILFCPSSVIAPSEVDPGNKDDRKLGMGILGLCQRVLR